MNKYIFIIPTLIISLLVTIYIFRYFIAYFFDLLKVSIINKNNLRNIQKIGIKKRNLANQDILKYIKLSKKYLNELNISTNKKFILNIDLERHLKFSRFDEKYLRELLDNILDYMNLDKNKINFKVNYISSKNHINYAGAFSSNNKNDEIVLFFQNDMSLNTVISILAHECSHYLLNSNNIRLNKTIENECLTDITSILLGFGKYMLDGYKISNRVLYNGTNIRNVKKQRVGYLTFKDVQYALKHIK